ncbi:MAG: NOG1 family protein [Thermoplasmata archaeon]|nr:NOG1 family protein [Thermoplasmata archaeon]
MFREIPTVLTAEEIIDKMFRRAKKVEVPLSRNKLLMHRNLSIAKIFTARDVAVHTLKRYVDKFPYINKMHPFYRSLLELLLDKNQYKKSLGALNWAIGKIESLATKYSRKIKGCGKIEEALKLRKEFYGRAASVIKQISSNLQFLAQAREIMRRLPDIDAREPTIVIAGYPNVGKSELVSKLSTAKPEIAAYPFTTKGIIVGHMETEYGRVQIIDTPGLLDRPLEKRNKIEKQAILALKYLANLIVFLLDPSETCGYKLEEQENLLDEIKLSFNVPILVVENKADLLRRESGFIKISAKTGEGVDMLVDLIMERVNTHSQVQRRL